jgi:hypothetical protein
VILEWKEAMTNEKLYDALDAGASIELNLAGVTFPCIRGGQRQDKIASLVKYVGMTLTLVPEPDNQYDACAIRVDADGVDIGYIPKKGTVWVDLAEPNVFTRPMRVDRDNLNEVLGAYLGPLSAKLGAIYGGYNGKNFGVSIKLFKEE